MKGPSTHEPSHPADVMMHTDVVFFEEGSLLSDASVEPLLKELGEAWRRGEQPLVEDVLARHPDLAENTDAVLRLICEEICLREEAGAEVPAEEYLGRFPKWQAEVQSLLDCRRLMQAAADVPVEVGLEQAPTLSDFQLLASLGEGAQGQVYLATQPALADRPVVVKITRCHGDEHRALARLQHTHIVPLYWWQDDAAKDRRILCMPYFGNVTLGDLFKILKDKPPEQRTGQDVLDILEKARSASEVQLPATGPARQFLARTRYAEAVCWMGACLADALHYAHERGLLHLDIKPTNVLLAADGQPMLLDFHLVRGPIRPDGPPPRGMGGTPYFMSPEQHLAMEAVCGGRPVTATVDGRSDVYSLGMVLYQALSGQVPMQQPPPRLNSCNPRVSAGLAAIIQKCLARDPRDRYRDAAALASDLRRHLGHLPLRGVPNRSWRERRRKWRRRKPHGLSVSLLLLLVLATGLTSWAYYLDLTRRRLVEANTFLNEVQTQIDEERYASALQSLKDWGGTSALLDRQEIAARYDDLQKLAARRQTMKSLHELVDGLRFLPGAEDHSQESLKSLDEQCRELWGARALILKELQTHEPQLERQLHTDLLDLAVIWTELTVGLARQGEARRRAWKEAIATLKEAESLTGPSPVLLYKLANYAEKLGLDEQAEKTREEQKKLEPHTGWEAYALGRAYLQRHDYNKARGYLDKAVRMEPRSFWPNFYQGVCAYRLGRHHDAVAAFRACLMLTTEKDKKEVKEREKAARCYYNRALAEAALGSKELALEDYSAARDLFPDLSAAWLNLGILEFDRKQYKIAESYLRTALAKGCDPVAGHYNLARVHQELGNRKKALAEVRLALKFNPKHPESRALLSSLELPTSR